MRNLADRPPASPPSISRCRDALPPLTQALGGRGFWTGAALSVRSRSCVRPAIASPPGRALAALLAAVLRIYPAPVRQRLSAPEAFPVVPGQPVQHRDCAGLPVPVVPCPEVGLMGNDVGWLIALDPEGVRVRSWHIRLRFMHPQTGQAVAFKRTCDATTLQGAGSKPPRLASAFVLCSIAASQAGVNRPCLTLEAAKAQSRTCSPRTE